MTPTTIPTPRTSARTFTDPIDREFARTLERELTIANENCKKLSLALSKISYLCGEPNEYQQSDYDVHFNEDEVVKRVEALKNKLAEWKKVGAELARIIEAYKFTIDSQQGQKALAAYTALTEKDK